MNLAELRDAWTKKKHQRGSKLTVKHEGLFVNISLVLNSPRMEKKKSGGKVLKRFKDNS